MSEKSAKESAERLFSIDNIISSYNTETNKIFSQKKNGFIHYYGTDERLHKAGLDINKCRKNILRYSNSEFCVFSILDDVKQFDRQRNSYWFLLCQNWKFTPNEG